MLAGFPAELSASLQAAFLSHLWPQRGKELCGNLLRQPHTLPGSQAKLGGHRNAVSSCWSYHKGGAFHLRGMDESHLNQVCGVFPEESGIDFQDQKMLKTSEKVAELKKWRGWEWGDHQRSCTAARSTAGDEKDHENYSNRRSTVTSEGLTPGNACSDLTLWPV